MCKCQYGLLFDLMSFHSINSLSLTYLHNHHLAAGVVNCYKRSATLGMCCLQSPTVRYVDDVKVARGGPASFRSCPTHLPRSACMSAAYAVVRYLPVTFVYCVETAVLSLQCCYVAMRIGNSTQAL